MACGQFKNDLFKQNLMNEELINIQKFVNVKLNKHSKKGTEELCQLELQKAQVKIKIIQEIVIGHSFYDIEKLEEMMHETGNMSDF